MLTTKHTHTHTQEKAKRPSIKVRANCSPLFFVVCLTARTMHANMMFITILSLEHTKGANSVQQTTKGHKNRPELSVATDRTLKHNTSLTWLCGDRLWLGPDRKLCVPIFVEIASSWVQTGNCVPIFVEIASSWVQTGNSVFPTLRRLPLVGSRPETLCSHLY